MIASRMAHMHDALVPDVAALRPPVRVGLAVALAQREALRFQAPHKAQRVVLDLPGSREQWSDRAPTVRATIAPSCPCAFAAFALKDTQHTGRGVR